jgi:ubiquinone/menaquinone biosynthesis C-methylase UbiE
MAATHPTAAAGFHRAADAYERGRPGYPADAVAHLAAHFRLGEGVTVLDLAAGTGKLTRMLATTGATVIAVEPVEGMRRVLTQAVPKARVLDGTAEHIPVADGSVDAVTVAQAFHWFDADRAVADIARVLRPGGGLGLIWNTFDTSVPWVETLRTLVGVHRHGEPAYGHTNWRDAFTATRLFEPLEEHTFGLVQELETEELVDRIGSTSYIATLAEGEREQLFGEIRALVADLPRPLRLPYRTDTYVTRRA